MKYSVILLVIAALAAAQQAPIAMCELRPALEEIRNAIAVSYEDLLTIEPGATGTVTVSFTIAPGGALTEVSITSDPGLESVARAADEAMQGLDYGPGLLEEPISITVPYNCIPPSEN
ncbi:MAG: TonB family protein [Candidatus Fermentibacter sp.]|nr:TonB family protein [Candidatus Fermentibacter sp.]